MVPHSMTYKVLYVLYRLVPLSMTLSDPEPQFQGHSIVKVEYLANGISDPFLGKGFRGQWIAWRYFRFDNIQDGG